MKVKLLRSPSITLFPAGYREGKEYDVDGETGNRLIELGLAAVSAVGNMAGTASPVQKSETETPKRRGRGRPPKPKE